MWELVEGTGAPVAAPAPDPDIAIVQYAISDSEDSDEDAPVEDDGSEDVDDEWEMPYDAGEEDEEDAVHDAAGGMQFGGWDFGGIPLPPGLSDGGGGGHGGSGAHGGGSGHGGGGHGSGAHGHGGDGGDGGDDEEDDDGEDDEEGEEDEDDEDEEDEDDEGDFLDEEGNEDEDEDDDEDDEEEDDEGGGGPGGAGHAFHMPHWHDDNGHDPHVAAGDDALNEDGAGEPMEAFDMVSGAASALASCLALPLHQRDWAAAGAPPGEMHGTLPGADTDGAGGGGGGGAAGGAAGGGMFTSATLQAAAEAGNVERWQRVMAITVLMLLRGDVAANPRLWSDEAIGYFPERWRRRAPYHIPPPPPGGGAGWDDDNMFDRWYDDYMYNDAVPASLGMLWELLGYMLRSLPPTTLASCIQYVGLPHLVRLLLCIPSNRTEPTAEYNALDTMCEAWSGRLPPLTAALRDALGSHFPLRANWLARVKASLASPAASADTVKGATMLLTLVAAQCVIADAWVADLAEDAPPEGFAPRLRPRGEWAPAAGACVSYDEGVHLSVRRWLAAAPADCWYEVGGAARGGGKWTGRHRAAMHDANRRAGSPSLLESLLRVTLRAMLQPTAYSLVAAASQFIFLRVWRTILVSTALAIRALHLHFDGAAAPATSALLGLVYSAVARVGGTVEAVRLGWTRLRMPAEAGGAADAAEPAAAAAAAAAGAAVHPLSPGYGMDAVLARAFRLGWAQSHKVPRVLGAISAAGRALTPEDGATLRAAAVDDALACRTDEVLVRALRKRPRTLLLLGQPSLLDAMADVAAEQASMEERSVYTPLAAGGTVTLAEMGRLVSVRVPPDAPDAQTRINAVDVALALGRPADLARTGRLDRDSEVYAAATRGATAANYLIDIGAAPPGSSSDLPPTGGRMAAGVMAKLYALTATLAAAPARSSMSDAGVAGAVAAAAAGAAPPAAAGGVGMLAAASAPLADAAATVFRLSVVPEGTVTLPDDTLDGRPPAEVVADGRRWLADILFMWRLAEMGLPPRPPAA